MLMEPSVATVEKFFSEAFICGCHKRAITILQGEDEDAFIVCEKDLTDPRKDFRRWIGRGNNLLCELVGRLLRGEEPYGLRVNMTVPFRLPQSSMEALPE